MDSGRDLILPRLGETMEEGTVVNWLVKPGSNFKRGQILAEIETDKTIVEMPALEAGILEEILVQPGGKIAVGGVLARISGSEPSTAKPAKRKAKSKQPNPRKQSKAAGKQTGKSVAKSTGAKSQKWPDRLVASPNARRVAAQMGVELDKLAGSGRRGRITAADVRDANANTCGAKSQALSLSSWKARHKSSTAPWLLIHGMFGNSASWNGLAVALAEAGDDVYAVDLPGHGRSAAAASLEPADIAAQIGTAIRLRHQGSLKVVGISLGAVFATELALQDGEVTQLHLLSPAGLGTVANNAFLQGMLSAARGGQLRPVLSFLGPSAIALSDKAVAKMEEDLRSRSEELERMAAAWFPQGSQKLSIREQLAQLQIPIKAILGTDDAVVPWQDARWLPDHVSAHFIDKAGHMPHLDRIDRVLALLRAR